MRIIALRVACSALVLLATQGMAAADGAQLPGAWDPRAGRLLVVGGVVDNALFDDVWELTPRSDTPTWKRLSVRGTPPPGRAGHLVVHDPVGHRLIVLGGYPANWQEMSSDIWTLSLDATPTWKKLAPRGRAPSPRLGASAVYDGKRRQLLLFGGFGANSQLFDEVWALTLAGTPTWKRLRVKGSPGKRAFHAAVHDLQGDRLIVFGGGSMPSPTSDVWALSLGGKPTWTALAPAGTAPPPRVLASATYDASRRRMLLYGGQHESLTHGDLWELSLGSAPAWRALTPGGSAPGPRRLPVLAVTGRDGCLLVYDGVHSGVFAFGGHASGERIEDDVWELCGSGGGAWRRIATAGTGLVAARRHWLTTPRCPTGSTFGCGYVTQGMENDDPPRICGCIPDRCPPGTAIVGSGGMGTWQDGSPKGSFSCSSSMPP